MEGYPVVFEHQILFRDLDALSHVNNVTFVAFMEDARMNYWKVLRQEHGLKRVNFILAEVTCKYLSPAYMGETLLIGIRVRNLGNKSFTFEYLMQEKDNGRLVAEASSVQVMYDYRQQKSVELGVEMREAVAAVEGLPLAELTAK